MRTWEFDDAIAIRETALKFTEDEEQADKITTNWYRQQLLNKSR